MKQNFVVCVFVITPSKSAVLTKYDLKNPLDIAL